MTNKLTVLMKTMILKMMTSAGFELTAAQMGEFMIENDYVSYSTFQSLIYEMEVDGLIGARLDDHITYYHIEEAGKQSLEFFEERLQDDIVEEIEDYVRGKKWEKREEVAVRSDYTLNANHEYSVRLQVIENGMAQIDLMITVPTERVAIQVCEQWEKENETIYGYLLQKLLC